MSRNRDNGASKVRRHGWAAVAVGGAVVASIATASAANAASATPGDFSSRVADNPQVYQVDDCTVEVGVVYDWTPYPSYAHVGGVRVNCASQHSVVDATVALYYWTGSQWQQYGGSSYGVRYNSFGSGYGLSGILRTNRYCVGTLRSQAWMVGTTVRTDRTGRTVYSAYHVDTSAGC